MQWVFIDFSYLAHRAFHAMETLAYEDLGTGVIYGFFEQLRTVCFDTRIKSNRVGLFVDSKQSYRKRLFPAYKQKRHEEKTPEEMAQSQELHRQMNLLIEALPGMGFPVYMQTGLESDDLIAKVGHRECFGGDVLQRGVMVTADGDLWQAITAFVSWFDPGRNVWLDAEGFRAKKAVWPCQWAGVKALCGCHSDGVPGIPGVGEITAIGYINGTAKRKGKRFDDIESPIGLAIIKRNLELVTLPHPKTRPFKLREPAYNPAAFFAFCEAHGVASYLEGKRWVWDAFFAGQMDGNRVQARRRT